MINAFIVVINIINMACKQDGHPQPENNERNFKIKKHRAYRADANNSNPCNFRVKFYTAFYLFIFKSITQWSISYKINSDNRQYNLGH